MYYATSYSPRNLFFKVPFVPGRSTLFFLFLILFTFSGTAPVKGQEQPQQKEVFMWVGAQKLQQARPATLENMLLFARRFDIIPYSSGMHDTEKLEGFLSLCRDLGIERTWIEVGPGRELTIEQFVHNRDARQKVLERFKAIARVYKRYYPEFARITLFDEAPLGAFKRPSPSMSYSALFEEYMEYGPEAFAHLYQAIKEVIPYAQVGIFMHHPHNASPEMAADYSAIHDFVARCKDQAALPDFIFSDVYRGYFTRGYGMEKTNQYITDVCRYTSEVAKEHGIKAYQLGQMHTIKLGYTPARIEIDQNVEAMLQGHIDGMGWYWPNYASTNYTRTSGNGIGEPLAYQISYRPFVPNAWGKTGPAGSVYATSKDRFVYSYLRMAETNGRLHHTTHFDLWIHGFDFDHAEHKVYIKTSGKRGSQWELIGHFNPQHDREAYEEGARSKYIYSYHDKWHALAFHGLSRNKYLSGEGEQRHAQVRIETSRQSDGSLLSAIYIMPYRPTRNYLTEDQVTRLIEDQPRWVETNSISSYVWPAPRKLKPGTIHNLKIE